MREQGARPRVVVVGAGVAGLACAIDLARQGCEVTVLERARSAGGKLREVQAGPGAPIDAGPTVVTMRWVFEALFDDAGANLAEHLELVPASVLARHYWTDGSSLDLHADPQRACAAIEEFAGRAEAQGYQRFCARSADMYRTLVGPYISSPRPSPLDLVRRVGWRRLDALWRTAPLQTLWSALDTHFRDPRLRQLFARYATYCGSSPFLAPATLMLVAHVEQEGVWTVAGGMARIARALVALGSRHGVNYRLATPVARIQTSSGRATAVETAAGERIAADAIVYNGDVSALATGLLGAQVSEATLATRPAARSLSALTWCLQATVSGRRLSHHNVFFGDDYGAEFTSIFAHAAITAAPTVYVCAQDRGADDGMTRTGPERLLLLINAPATGDAGPLPAPLLAEYERRAHAVLERCGATLTPTAYGSVATTPADFERLYPGTGGALYGRANHGPWGSFARPGSLSQVPGLYLAGGSAHPGPGLPMATMSGRLAAERVLRDLRG